MVTNGKLHGPDDITVSFEVISPHNAESFLSKNMPRNRSHVPSISSRYHRDMIDGNWIVTHEGIAFNDRGELIDGQHRLHAIVKSGKPQMMLVVRGLSLRALEVINRGKTRTLAHALQCLGVPNASNRFVAAARVMFFGVNNPPAGRLATEKLVTDHHIKLFIETNVEALTFGVQQVPSRVGPAVICGLIARAYYHINPSELSRFIQAMADQIHPDDGREGDRTARALTAVMSRMRNVCGGSMRTSLYRKAQNALKAYLENRVIASLHEVSEDLFPLPDGAFAGQPKVPFTENKAGES